MPKDLLDKQYIGDGVYIGHDGYHVWIQTENGSSVTNEVALEPSLISLVVLYFKMHNFYKEPK